MRRNPHMKLTFFQADGQWAFTWGKHDVVRLRNSTAVFFNKVEDAVRAAARLRLQVLANGDVVTESGEEHVPLEMDDKFAPDGTYQRTYGQTFNALRRNPVSRLMGKTLRTRTGASIMVTLDLEKPQPYSVVLVEGETATSWDFDTRADAQAAAEELRREIDGPRQNPLRAEHSARQHAPEGYKSCGRVTIHHDDKPIGLLTCSPTGRRSAHDTEVASVRFPVEHWTAKQAKAWLKANGYSTAHFKEAIRSNPGDYNERMDWGHADMDEVSIVVNTLSNFDNPFPVVEALANALPDNLKRSLPHVGAMVEYPPHSTSQAEVWAFSYARGSYFDRKKVSSAARKMIKACHGAPVPEERALYLACAYCAENQGFLEFVRDQGDKQHYSGKTRRASFADECQNQKALKDLVKNEFDVDEFVIYTLQDVLKGAMKELATSVAPW